MEAPERTPWENIRDLGWSGSVKQVSNLCVTARMGTKPRKVTEVQELRICSKPEPSIDFRGTRLVDSALKTIGTHASQLPPTSFDLVRPWTSPISCLGYRQVHVENLTFRDQAKGPRFPLLPRLFAQEKGAQCSLLPSDWAPRTWMFDLPRY